jgi:hypothetical protein
MSIYDDVKKAITEFLLPELKTEIAKVNGRLDTLAERVSQNESRAEERHQYLLREIGWRFDSIKGELELARRIDVLERKQKEPTQ